MSEDWGLKRSKVRLQDNNKIIGVIGLFNKSNHDLVLVNNDVAKWVWRIKIGLLLL
jgi:hypothetical protein